MNSCGFEFRRDSGGVALEFVMPEGLRWQFFVSFYGKSTLLDEADGSPAAIWRSFSGRYAAGAALVAPYQEHGVNVADCCGENALPLRPRADGVFIGPDPGACASLRFADCAPVVIACESEKPWLLLLHSGFVGTVKNISGTALAARRGDTGALHAWIGPAICDCCYTRRLDDPKTAWAMESFHEGNYSTRNGVVHFDIRGEIKKQLLSGGVRPENIYVSGFCTGCDNGDFYSYRAEGGDRRSFLLAVPGKYHKNI